MTTSEACRVFLQPALVTLLSGGKREKSGYGPLIACNLNWVRPRVHRGKDNLSIHDQRRSCNYDNGR